MSALKQKGIYALDPEDPEIEDPLGGAAEVLDHAEERLDGGVVDLVARAANEMERLGGDMAIGAGDR